MSSGSSTEASGSEYGGSTDSDTEKSYDSEESEEEEKTEDEVDDEEIADAPEEEFEDEADFELPVEDEQIEEDMRKKFRRKPQEEPLLEIERSTPPVSDAHLAHIEHLKSEGRIYSQAVYDVMKLIDFGCLYYQTTEEWRLRNAIMLENVNSVLKPGMHILSCPLNMYFNICLALMVGQGGSVLCFGHAVNVNMLKAAKLDWLLQDQRLILTNDGELYSGIPYAKFLEHGFEYMAPYDMVLLTEDGPLCPSIERQVKPGGICFPVDSCEAVPLEDHAESTHPEPDAGPEIPQ